MDISLSRAIEAVGGQSALAETLELTPQAIQQWRRVPAEQVLDVARATGWRITPHRLRPDLYPHHEDGLPKKLRRRAS